MLNQMYEQYCANRLPCGICRLTNSQCPKVCGITFDWTKVTCTSAPVTNPDKDSVTYSTSTECIVNCGKGVENR